MGPESRSIMMGSYGFLRGLRPARWGLLVGLLAEEEWTFEDIDFFPGVELVR